MRKRALLSAIAIVWGALAIEHAGAESPAHKADDPGRVTCETTRPPGSRLGGVRRCRTRAEWDRYRAEMRDVTHRIQAEGATNCVPTTERPNIC